MTRPTGQRVASTSRTQRWTTVFAVLAVAYVVIAIVGGSWSAAVTGGLFTIFATIHARPFGRRENGGTLLARWSTEITRVARGWRRG